MPAGRPELYSLNTATKYVEVESVVMESQRSYEFDRYPFDEDVLTDAHLERVEDQSNYIEGDIIHGMEVDPQARSSPDQP